MMKVYKNSQPLLLLLCNIKIQSHILAGIQTPKETKYIQDSDGPALKCHHAVFLRIQKLRNRTL
jgi:hypothetical protein